jgi:hypothetical protein
VSRTVKHLVDRGLELRAQIEPLLIELKAVDEALREEALKGEQVPLEDAERDGMQYLARGSKQIVPVVITADCVVDTFKHAGKTHDKIREAVEAIVARTDPPGGTPRVFTEFFRPVNTWERRDGDGKKFRHHAREFLGDESAGFIDACLSRDKEGVPKNSLKVDWDRAREAAK